MKFGFNLLLWTDTLTDGAFHHVEALQKMGYDAVELPIFDLDGVAACTRWGTLLDNLGLSRTGTCAFGPGENVISADPAVRRRGVDANKKVLDCCAAAGCTVMAGNSASSLGVFTGDAPTETEWKWGVEGMREVAEHAQAVGVKVALEALNRFENYFITCAAQGAAFVHAVNHPFLGMMYDTFHAHIEEKSVAGAIREVKDCLFHVHISENDRSTPGKGQVRWDETFDTLHEIGYDGTLVCEAFGSALKKLAAATKIWRKMFDTEDQLARDTLAFMKREVEKRWK